MAKNISNTSPKVIENNGNERFVRNNVLIGRLPEDFLRLSDIETSNGAEEGSTEVGQTRQQIQCDEEVAMALQQQQYSKWNASPQNIRGRLDVTIAEARLVKNYGVTRMDPYVRLRIGHHIYETRTCYNGAKNPKWNKVFHCYLPQGVDSFHIEIYDECSFTIDEMIAWTLYKIPESTMNSQTVEEWVDLNGKQGDGKEGQICIVTSFTPLNRTALQNTGYSIVPPPMVPVLVPNPYSHLPFGTNQPLPQVYVQSGPLPAVPPQTPAPQMQPIVVNEEDVKRVSEMFPNVEIEVIKAILETERGNKDRAINSLLQITNENN